MKIDHRDPWHWLLLALFSANVLLGLLLRPFVRRDDRKVLLYGHKLNGNLLALYLESDADDTGLELEFLTMDPLYWREIRQQGIRTTLAISPRTAWLLARIDAVVTDHGLHAMTPLPKLTNIRFYDAWHGIPFKGFDSADFRAQHQYRETWVTSPHLKRLYVDRFGFRKDQVVVTGYARTDRLLNTTESPEQARQQLGLPADRKLILFAPTWAQDSRGRSVFPFGLDEVQFMGHLSVFAEQHDCSILLRPHLNSPLSQSVEYPRVYLLPSKTHPDTEQILLASDVLVCDWSSIAFDFLLLNRPTIFLDVEPPFRKGFSLGPEFRFDKIVRGVHELQSALKDAILVPGITLRRHASRREEVTQTVYGEYADGNSAQRCLDRLTSARD
jgi:CDP-glycerol glycerophosphotransferase